MPIDYKKYPPNWRKEIVPRILKRADNKCEFCGLANKQVVFSVRYNAKSTWFLTEEEAELAPKTFESKMNKETRVCETIPNPKRVTVVLTIAHLDHDETNWDIKDERLKAACQMCHLKYDGKEKYLRRNGLK